MSDVTYQLNPPKVSLYAEKLMFKLLFEHNLFSKIFTESGWKDDDIAFSLGLPEELENLEGSKTIIRELFTARAKQIARRKVSVPKNLTQAYQNLARLSEFVGFNETEYELLRFALHLRNDKALSELGEYVQRVNLYSVIRILASLLK